MNSLHFGGHLQSSCLLNWVRPKNSLEQGTFWKFWKVTAINPLSPNIHIQILQTDLHTFPWRISWENLIEDQIFFSFWIILLFLVDYAHDSLWISLGENWFWALLGLKGLRPIKGHGKSRGIWRAQNSMYEPCTTWLRLSPQIRLLTTAMTSNSFLTHTGKLLLRTYLKWVSNSPILTSFHSVLSKIETLVICTNCPSNRDV